jgi:hypothetical protein
MFIYWLLFAFPAFFALVGQRRKLNNSNDMHSLHLDPLWLSMIVFMTLVIGTRNHVGGDWYAYLRMYRYVFEIQDSFGSDLVYLFGGDAGYLTLNWISAKLNGGIHGVNLLCGFIFSVGLALFCRNLPRPFLALAVATPYMVVVVSMGYSRQATAIGVIMIALVMLSRQRPGWFIFWTVAAALFHKSAIIMLPIAALAGSKNKFLSLFLIVTIGLTIYYTILAAPFELLYKNYIAAQDSQARGALVRVLMCVFPSLIYLTWPHRFAFKPHEKPLWNLMCLISVGLFILLLVNSDISIAVDRIALYMLPIQLVIFSNVPDMLNDRKITSQFLVFAVVLYYFCVLFVWLNFADNAGDWVPYATSILDFSVETYEIID